MRSTPVEDLIDIGGSIADEDTVENDIVQLQNDIRDSGSYDTPKFQNEINEMRNELDMLKKKNKDEAGAASTATSSDKQANDSDESATFEDVFRYKKKKDVLEIVCLLTVYVIFSLNNVNEIIDNLIPFMFYNYTLLIKGVLFILTYRSLKVFLGKLNFIL